MPGQPLLLAFLGCKHKQTTQFQCKTYVLSILYKISIILTLNFALAGGKLVQEAM